ncbi:hypothetical protein [Alteromonas flava]|uniref:hypothetical protein n=1 Tax=Alteromonas flava TaxID=2048003 RepID=UPI000C285DB1|nr:hypothetical protein [Alteromonas flava]
MKSNKKVLVPVQSAYREIVIGLTTIFAWVPSLVLVFLSIFIIYMGGVALVEGEIKFAVSALLLGVGGVLGFISLTSLCWGLYVPFLKRLIFLLAGVISLSIVIALTHTEALWLSLSPNILVAYLFYSPLTLGIFHIILHLCFWRKSKDIPM